MLSLQGRPVLLLHDMAHLRQRAQGPKLTPFGLGAARQLPRRTLPPACALGQLPPSRGAWNAAARQAGRRRLAPVCALSPVPRGPFQGVYGPWRIEDRDITEVWVYRAGLTVTAAGGCAAARPGAHPQHAAAGKQRAGICKKR